MTWPIVIDKGSPKHRLWQVVGYALLAGAIFWVAYRFQNYQLLNFARAAADAVAILGLMIIIGYSGQVSIGQSFFFGLGAYVTAWLGVDHGWNFLLTLPVSAAIGMAIGFLVGIPALRIRGLYLALVTLALAAVFPVLAKLEVMQSITGGANGKPADDIIWTTPGWVPGSPSNQAWQFLVLCAVGAVLFILASNMMKSRPGRNLIALRDSEVGAAVSGVWPAGWKTGAFAISAAYGALGGSMLVFVTRIAAPETGGFATAIALLTGAVLGGLGTISGAVVGALAVTFVPYYTNEFMAGDGFLFIPASDRPRDFLIFQGGDGPILAGALYGVLLIAVVFVMPGGIIYFVRLMRSKLIRFVPKLPDVSAPRRDEPSPAELEPAGAIIQPRGGEPA
jgi:branched-chain amino acid transport system permease protein